MEDYVENEVILSVHIEYINGFTVRNMALSLDLLNEAFEDIYSEYVEEEQKRLSPNVINVKNGSLFVDVVVPVACAALPIIYDIIKNKINSNNNFKANVKQKRQGWSDKDNYEFTKKVMKEYVINNNDTKPTDFVNNYRSHKFNYNSLIMKLSNTKWLLENYTENTIDYTLENTLEIGQLNKASKKHKEAYIKAGKDLGLF